VSGPAERPAVPIVTALYVPGDRPDRFDKAAVSGTQLVIVDLEDAVIAERKAAARAAVVDWLRGRRPDGVRVDVRVNAADTPYQRDDAAAVAELDASVGVRIAKVASASDIERVAAIVGRRPIDALVETARGVEALPEIASHPAATSVSLGEADLASDLGSRDPAVLDWVRIRLLVAVRAAGLPAPMMSVYPQIDDLDGLRADTERGRSLGFVGRTAVHPSQLSVIAAAFRPTEAELAWAADVLEATAAGGVTRLASGEMVDPAMRGRAEHLLALAAATVPHPSAEARPSADRPDGGPAALG
jgi:citrate lyase subunit beta/citryl-CoA lyase